MMLSSLRGGRVFRQRINLAADLPDYRQAGGRSNL